MRSAKGLQITLVVFLITKITLVNSVAQNVLVRTLRPDPDELNHGHNNAPAMTSPTPAEESRSSSAVPARAEPSGLRSRDPRKLGLLDRAYLDAFTILNDENECSRFFGGKPAISALTELVLQLKPRYLAEDIAIQMTGNTTHYLSNRTGFSFRLFDKAEINLAGSFFRSSDPSKRRVSVTSVFRPNTRETRVVVLLHELGHLVRTADRRWVLPDDGADPSLSSENTERVVSACRQQIESLSRMTHAQELEMALSDAQLP